MLMRRQEATLGERGCSFHVVDLSGAALASCFHVATAHGKTELAPRRYWAPGKAIDCGGCHLADFSGAAVASSFQIATAHGQTDDT
mmetsp:Transcript_9708/g.25114  ORF Transcript_9708/g.25114 Transcript_9708/m.25114 type:complete len:86 (+) Transcript_9708:3-260(+)